jgi:tRNA pseudouridine55 synthase
MNGFLLADKPKGVTSFYCIKVLRRLTGVRKMGFVGTLDPLATGLMIFAVGEATKLIPFLEGMDKVYNVKVRFGAVSDTYDGEGQVEEVKNARKPARAEIEHILKDDFLGERDQVPPVFSAIQVEGRRSYDLARKNKKVKLKSRKVNFYDLVVKSYAWPNLRIAVHCGSGTYVRSFAHDLGQKLGCGGYVDELRRTKIGGFSVKDSVKLDEIEHLNVRKLMVSPEDLFIDWARIDLNGKEYKVLSHGGFLDNKTRYKKGPILAIHEGKCVGVLEIRKGQLKFLRKFN